MPRNRLRVVRKVEHFLEEPLFELDPFCDFPVISIIMGCNLDKVQSTEAAGDVQLPVSEKLRKGT